MIKVKNKHKYLVSGFTRNGEYFSDVLLDGISEDGITMFEDEFNIPYSFQIVEDHSKFALPCEFTNHFDQRKDLYVLKLQEISKLFGRNKVLLDNPMNLTGISTQLEEICLIRTRDYLKEQVKNPRANFEIDRRFHDFATNYCAPYLILSAHLQKIMKGKGMQQMSAFDAGNMRKIYFRYSCNELTSYTGGVQIGVIEPVISEDGFTKISSDGMEWFGTELIVSDAQKRFNSTVFFDKSPEQIIDIAYKEARQILGLSKDSKFEPEQEEIEK